VRKILNDRDALDYIQKALINASIEDFDQFDLKKLPEILEAFDDVEPLVQDDANYIIAMIMNNYDKMVAYCIGQMN
jgi:hypothetical protein